jgi:hypothetical protein
MRNSSKLMVACVFAAQVFTTHRRSVRTLGSVED